LALNGGFHFHAVWHRRVILDLIKHYYSPL
jgi:hypothetical protein